MRIAQRGGKLGKRRTAIRDPVVTDGESELFSKTMDITNVAEAEETRQILKGVTDFAADAGIFYKVCRKMQNVRLLNCRFTRPLTLFATCQPFWRTDDQPPLV